MVGNYGSSYGYEITGKLFLIRQETLLHLEVREQMEVQSNTVVGPLDPAVEGNF